ncbi:hypothetical protein GDO78_006825 [Eleutherodactylus coqui]|uniref:Uncharacterized protein n=2 Tax=Eleutherodactylus coqui TaxID=57060 RepID=A0A8J6KCH9_ELECQ|nr:hypothetical protein GDO78_006825 [Eleutherodactylus coqui]
MQKRRSDTSWSTPPTSSSLHCTPTQSQPDARSAALLQLAQQVADYIVNDSPKPVPNRGMELEDLIGMLSSDPFLSTKEIPRTPENLISDIRTSWREAIQTEEIAGASSPLESPCRETPAEPEPAHCSQIDLSMACFLSTSLLSEQNDSPETHVATSTKPSSLQEKALSRSTLHSPTSENKELQPEKVTSLKESENARTFSPLVEKSETNMFQSQSSGKMMDNTTLQSFLQPENVSAQTTLSWNSSKMADYNYSSDSHEVIQFGILHETLPEGAGNVSLNSTTSLETPEAKKSLSRGDQLLQNTDYSCNSVDRKVDINSIRTRYEALKKTFYIDETGQEQTPLRRICKQKSESCLQTDFGNVCSPLEEGLSLEYFMTPFPKGRKLSLPQLISFSPDNEVHGRRLEELADVFDSQGPGALTRALDLSQPTLSLQQCTDEGTGQLITL